MPETASDATLSTLLWTIGSAVAICAILVIGAYLFVFRGGLAPPTHEAWGQFGDYFGGLLNPVVGMATVVLVILSINMQRMELRNSLAELKNANAATALMSFEQSLFAWLSNYRDLVQSVHAANAQGRYALTSLYEATLDFPVVYAHKTRSNVDSPIFKAQVAIYASLIDWKDEASLTNLDSLVFVARTEYSKMYENFQTELDALPRTIFRLLRWIETSPLTLEQKWHYAALVRAQLSWTELALLFYNCYSTHGEQFAAIANRFALFDNLNPGKDVLIKHIRLRPDREIAAPLKPQAFSSDLAKAAMGLAQQKAPTS
ncbi:hypothetical protein ASD75_04570 [Acidovorax sp. Root568]|nr:hypothetical protein ASD75_04570 [Acidovorax sp. Root568]